MCQNFYQKNVSITSVKKNHELDPHSKPCVHSYKKNLTDPIKRNYQILVSTPIKRS